MHAGVSERARLAGLARDAALEVPGVVALAGGRGGQLVTLGPDGRPLQGVLCAAGSNGGYDVSLALVAEMVALRPLGERVAERVRARAEAAGLGGALERVDVSFSDIVTRAGR